MTQSWLAFTLVSLGLYGLVGIFAKISSGYIDARSMAVTQGLAYIVISLALLGSLGFKLQVHTVGSPAALLAGLAAGLGTVAVFFAYSRGGQASLVSPMVAMYPLVTIPLSIVVLKEQITIFNGLGIVLALAAVVLFSR